MTVSPLVRSPLRCEIINDGVDQGVEQRLQQILEMRKLLHADFDEDTPPIPPPKDIEPVDHGVEAVAQAYTFRRPQAIKLIRIHRRRRSQDSDSSSESSLSLAETLVNQSADQLIRDKAFLRSHGKLTHEVQVHIDNARADQERLKNWINSMNDVVERLEQRRLSDPRLDASLQVWEQQGSWRSTEPKRRSTVR